jgi:demethylmenaquinone methyltransferase/2-methoxy-6-polyprenyl-1,4-benzoquinol methylase
LDVENTRREAWRLFDRIAARYDFLNRLLSMRQDVVWRKKLARFLPKGEKLNILDVATGTADQILFLLQQSKRIEKVVGIDLSENMLAIGQKKIDQLNLSSKVSLRSGDGANLPFDDVTFNAVTISFGIRNILQYSKSLQEMFRVLKPGGKVIILEFSLPKSTFVRLPYLFYFRKILPVIGGQLSGDKVAYSYLNQTVEDFPYGLEFLKKMGEVGFADLEAHPLSLGIATIYVGTKK